MLTKIRQIIGLETDKEKLFQYEGLKEEYDEISSRLDFLADSFLLEKSLYEKRIADEENYVIQSKITERWNNFKELQKKDVQEAKRRFDKLSKSIDDIEKSLKSKIDELKLFNTIKKAYKSGILNLEDYNESLKKVTKDKVTKYSDFLLFNENGELLLLKRSTWEDDHQGAWVIPGGHVDMGEDFESAATRELWEESGFRPDTCSNVGNYIDDKVHIEYFQGSVNTKEQSPLLDVNESRDYKWINLEDLDDYNMIFNMKENIKKILKLETIKTNIKKSSNFNLEEVSNEDNGIILTDKLNSLYKSFFTELEKSNAKYKFLIEKGFNEEAEKIAQDIEKAKKDISKLNKIKKLVYRDGKLVLGTYYVKTGHEEVDETKVSTKTGGLTKDLSVGETITFVDNKGISYKGQVVDFEYDEDRKFHYICIRDESGKRIWKSLRLLRGIRTIPFGEEKVEDELEEEKLEEKKIVSIPKLNELFVVRSLGGSSNVMLATAPDGRKFAIKKPHKDDIGQLRQEKIINDLYLKLGFRAPYGEIDEDNKVLISLYVEGAEELGSTRITPELKKEIQKGYVLDALLANWDVLGQNKDNILVKDGKVYRIDNGGCLATRARGGSKEFKGDSVPEIDSLKSYLPGKEIFGSITDEEIRRQVDELDKNRDKLFIALSDIDRNLLIKVNSRLNYLVNTYGSGSSKAEETKVEEPPKDVLRPDMPSMVTQKYFDEKYSKVNISGNKGINEHIKKHIIEIENSNDLYYEREAKKRGLTVEQFKEKMQMMVESIVGRSTGYIVAKNSLIDNILTEGRFKTQFETGTSEGVLCEDSRNVTELVYFGFDKKTEKREMRPIYGFFTDHAHGVINNTGSIPPPRTVSQYGDVCFEVKGEKFYRDATITFKDSLGSERSMAAVPVSAPHFTAFNPSHYDNLVKMYNDKVSSSEAGHSYVEAQYHGQLKLTDIEKIHVSIGEYNDNKMLSRVINSINAATLKGGKLVPIEIF